MIEMINKILLVILIALAIMSSCGKEDLSDINYRVSTLEDWRQSVNNNITSLQGLVQALQQKDFVTDVKPLSDGSGYQINFLKNTSIIIRNGGTGITPIIGTKQYTDGKYYWTVNGEWLLSGTTKIQVAGEKGESGLSPRIGANGNWWVGNSDTGVEVQGDAVFAKNGFNNSRNDYLEVTLADGTTKIRLPKYKSFKIGADSSNGVLEISASTTIELKLPDGLKTSDCSAMIAQVVSSRGIGADIQTRSVNSEWKVRVNLPTFTNGVCNNNASVEVTPPTGIDNLEEAVLEITILSNLGTRIETSRNLKKIVMYSLGDYYPDPDVTFNPDKTVASGTAPIGIVFRLSNEVDGKSRSGWIINLKQSLTKLSWGAKTKNDELDTYNGFENMKYIKNMDPDFSNHPAYKYAHDLNPSTTDYTGSSKGIWYLPTFRELHIFYTVYNQSPLNSFGLRYPEHQERFNKKISDAGGMPILSEDYWSSHSERNIENILIFNFYSGNAGWKHFSDLCNVRAISEF